MRKSGLTGDEAYILSKHGKTAEDLGPLKKEIGSITEDLGNIGKVIEVGGEKTISTPQLADISTIKIGRPTFKYHQTKYNDGLSSEEYYKTLDAIEFNDEEPKTLRLNFKPSMMLFFRSDGTAEGGADPGKYVDNKDGTYTYTTTKANMAKWIRITWSTTTYPKLIPLVTLADKWSSDADPTFTGSKTIIIPTSLKDKTVDVSNLSDDVLNLLYPKISNPCDYKGDEICFLGKGICIGDSVTEGVFDRNDSGNQEGFQSQENNWVNNLIRMTGLDLTNKGTAGKTFKTWWDIHQNDDFSGFKFAIIALGVNDGFFKGGWTDEAFTALTAIVKSLKEQSNGIKIFITTPPQYWAGYNGADWNSVSDGIRSSAESLGLYLIDFREYLTEFSLLNFDKISVMKYGHPNAYGYYVLAKSFKAYISYIISQNIDDFKNIQFIGTTYSYSSN